MTASSDTTARPAPRLPAIQTGPYRHYKGGLYEVLGIACHSETLEPLVLYRVQDGDGTLWVRPWSMFTGTLTVDGELVQRFRPLQGAS